MDDFRPWVALAIFIGIGVFLHRTYRSMRKTLSDPTRDADEFPFTCQKCDKALKSTARKCPNCGRRNDGYFRREMFDRLTSDWPPDGKHAAPTEPEPSERRVRVHETTEPQEMDLWTEQFLARGIWCEVVESEPFRQGTKQIAAGEYLYLHVKASDADRAKKLVRYFRGGKTST